MEDFLSTAAPLLLTSCGALLTELAGSLCIACDGFMRVGAFFAYFFAVKTGSVLLGNILCAVLAFVTGWLLAVLTDKIRANPFIMALAFNMAASGALPLFQSLAFGTKGPLSSPFPPVSRVSFFYLSVAAALFCWYFLRFTHWGLRLRSCGLGAEEAAYHGVKVWKWRAFSWALAAAFSALAGAALTWRAASYVSGAPGGRAWAALAAVFLGFRTIPGTAAASLIFAAAFLLAMSAQSLNLPLPLTALSGLPYALAFALYALSGKINTSRSRNASRFCQTLAGVARKTRAETAECRVLRTRIPQERKVLSPRFIYPSLFSCFHNII